MRRFFFLSFLFLSQSIGAQTDQELVDKFIYLSGLVQTSLQRDLTLLPEVSRKKIADIIESYRSEAKVSIVPDRPVDNRGVEKAAVFYTNGEVRIHRESFREMDLQAKAQLAALELLGLAGMDKHRYEVVVSKIFPFPDELFALELIQEKMCYEAAQFALNLVGLYMKATMSCWASEKKLGMNTTQELEARLRRAIGQCRLECAFGHNDSMTQKGWCDGALRNMEGMKAHTRKDLNKLKKGMGDWCVGIPGSKRPRGVKFTEIPL